MKVNPNGQTTNEHSPQDAPEPSCPASAPSPLDSCPRPGPSAIAPDLSRKLSAVSFIAAVGVVFIHSYPSTITRQMEPTIETFLCCSIEELASSFAVPMFFVISGYLFAMKTDLGRQPRWYPATLKKKVGSLLVPFLIWCTIYAVFYIPFKLYGNHLAGRDLVYALPMLSHPLLSGWNICGIYGLILPRYPGCPILWFVRNLMLLFLVSPLFLFLFRKRFAAVLFLIIVFIAIVFEYRMPFWHSKRGFSFCGLLYFPLGIFFAFYPLSHSSFPTIRRMLPLLWIATNFIATAYYQLNILGNPYRFLCDLNTLLGVGSIWVLPDFIRPLLRLGSWKFAKDTFFLYVFHYLVLAFVFSNSMEKILLYKLHIPFLAIYFLKIFGSAVPSLIVAELMKKHLPALYRTLTGGR